MRSIALSSALVGVFAVTSALEIDISSPDSIKSVASTIAYGMMSYYNGNVTGGIPGLLPGPYYWWEAGAMFGTLIDYWHYTGDSSYNDVTMQAMMHQITPKGDFLPVNQTNAMGNDDQGFWGMTAMMAAEAVFPNPPSDTPQWLAGAQAVFNEYVVRWNEEKGLCGGGLRWQVYSFLKGWSYKNSISNGCFLNIGARLARYTGNKTYAEWAEKVYDWERQQGIITDDYEVYDGVQINETAGTCTEINRLQFTYNAGILLHGAATLYNFTGDEKWKARVDGFLDATLSTFRKDGVLYEPACELIKTCDQNMISHKSYLIRFLAATTKMAPWTYANISKVISDAGQAAAAACNGPVGANFHGIDGTACGFSWLQKGVNDGITGVGPQMCALTAVLYNLNEDAQPPATADDRGTSEGDPGGGSTDPQPLPQPKPITAGDRVGAGILTVLITGGIVVGSLFLVSSTLD